MLRRIDSILLFEDRFQKLLPPPLPPLQLALLQWLSSLRRGRVRNERGRLLLDVMSRWLNERRRWLQVHDGHFVDSQSCLFLPFSFSLVHVYVPNSYTLILVLMFLSFSFSLFLSISLYPPLSPDGEAHLSFFFFFPFCTYRIQKERKERLNCNCAVCVVAMHA